jgi:hypothetical protein
MISYRNQTGEGFRSLTITIDGWQQVKNPRWAHTSLRRVSAMHTTASMWAPEPSFTMPPSHITGTGARWKRFLSRASLRDIPYGSDPQDLVPCRAKRLLCGRDLDLEKAAIAY